MIRFNVLGTYLLSGCGLDHLQASKNVQPFTAEGQPKNNWGTRQRTPVGTIGSETPANTLDRFDKISN